MASISDIASRAQTSTGTVSRVLNNSQHVSAQVRERVLAAIKELNYKPGVIKNSPRFILVTYNQNSFNRGDYEQQLLRYLIPELNANGYGVQLIDIQQLKDFDPRHVSLIINIDLTPDCKEILENYCRFLPIISLNSGFKSDKLINIQSDHAQGMYMAIKYLVRMGHKQTAYINVKPGNVTQQQRALGIEKAKKDYDINTSIHYIDKSTMLFETIDAILDQKVSSMLLGNGSFILPVYSALRKLGVRIPDEMSILSVDDGELANELFPRVTIIRQPVDLIVNKAVDLIPKILAGQVPKKIIPFQNELVLRDSVRNLKID